MITSRDHQFFLYATELTKLSECQHRMAAVLVNGRKILGTGTNVERTHPIMMIGTNTRRLYLHAEASAIVNARIRRARTPFPSKMTIYVARLRRDNKLGNSKPCPICREILEHENIRRIIYWDDELKEMTIND